MSLLPLSHDGPVVDSDGKALAGFGQVLKGDSKTALFEQEVDYTMNTAVLILTLVFGGLFGFYFTKVETAEPNYAVPPR